LLSLNNDIACSLQEERDTLTKRIQEAGTEVVKAKAGAVSITLSGVQLKLFCPEAKNSSQFFKFIELWGAILVEVIKIKSKVGHHDMLRLNT
jgi:hypothetical protein